MRKYPPLVTLNRVVTKPYVIPGTQIKLKTGTKIVIPVHAIHYDPKYYSDPEAFEPDRFSDENIHNLHPNTYMPFGDGPRFCIGTFFIASLPIVFKCVCNAKNCIYSIFVMMCLWILGKRFAEFEMKMALSEVLTNYEVTSCDKTQIPIKYVIGSFVNIPESVWLKFRKLNT